MANEIDWTKPEAPFIGEETLIPVPLPPPRFGLIGRDVLYACGHRGQIEVPYVEGEDLSGVDGKRHLDRVAAKHAALPCPACRMEERRRRF